MKFNFGDYVITNTGWMFQVDKIDKKQHTYYEVGGQGADEDRLSLAATKECLERYQDRIVDLAEGASNCSTYGLQVGALNILTDFLKEVKKP